MGNMDVPVATQTHFPFLSNQVSSMRAILNTLKSSLASPFPSLFLALSVVKSPMAILFLLFIFIPVILLQSLIWPTARVLNIFSFINGLYTIVCLAIAHYKQPKVYFTSRFYIGRIYIQKTFILFQKPYNFYSRSLWETRFKNIITLTTYLEIEI